MSVFQRSNYRQYSKDSLTTADHYVMKFNTNNISIISWQSALQVKETGLPEENHLPVASH
jgi:hypothetical protein